MGDTSVESKVDTEGRGEALTQTHEERNQGILRGWYSRWVWNAATNFAHIRREFLVRGQNNSLFVDKDKHRGEPAIIVGSGPSLEKAAPHLRKWRGAIFCSASNALMVRRWAGRNPDYLCIFDANRSWDAYLKGNDWRGTTLITHPSIEPKTMRRWPSHRRYYLMMHIPRIDRAALKQHTDGNKMDLDDFANFIKRQHFGTELFENINPTLFPMIQTVILNAGCTANNAIQCADFMGYDPLFLCGIDFGFPNGRVRTTGWRRKSLWQIVRDAAVGPSPQPNDVPKDMLTRRFSTWRAEHSWNRPNSTDRYRRRQHRSENGILTTEEQIEYKIAMFSIMKIDKPNLIDCSDGIITELPKIDIAEVIGHGGYGFDDRLIGAGLERSKRDEAVGSVADAFLVRQRKNEQRLLDERNGNRPGEEVRPEGTDGVREPAEDGREKDREGRP